MIAYESSLLSQLFNLGFQSEKDVSPIDSLKELSHGILLIKLKES